MDTAGKHQDEAFEALLAEVLQKAPTVKPSANFADMVVAALPEQAPIVIPEPKPALNPWCWLIGSGIAVAAACTGMALWWSELMVWFQFQSAVLSFDTMLLIADLKTAITNADTSVIAVVALAAFALIARSGASLASGKAVSR